MFVRHYIDIMIYEGCTNATQQDETKYRRCALLKCKFRIFSAYDKIISFCQMDAHIMFLRLMLQHIYAAAGFGVSEDAI